MCRMCKYWNARYNEGAPPRALHERNPFEIVAINILGPLPKRDWGFVFNQVIPLGNEEEENTGSERSAGRNQAEVGRPVCTEDESTKLTLLVPLRYITAYDVPDAFTEH